MRYIHKSPSAHSNPIHQYIFMIHHIYKLTNGYSCFIYSSPTLLDDENELKMICEYTLSAEYSFISVGKCK